MTTRDTMPILLVDTDALADLTPWEPLAKARAWAEFYSHIPDAKPRDNGLLDMLELAKSEGCWVVYTSRWDDRYRQAVWEWLRAQGFPRGSIYLRPYARISAAGLAFNHVRIAAKRAYGNRPVIVIHNDAGVAAALRQRGIAAITAAHVPQTVTGFRDMLTCARRVANTKPDEKGGPPPSPMTSLAPGRGKETADD